MGLGKSCIMSRRSLAKLRRWKRKWFGKHPRHEGWIMNRADGPIHIVRHHPISFFLMKCAHALGFWTCFLFMASAVYSQVPSVLSYPVKVIGCTNRISPQSSTYLDIMLPCASYLTTTSTVTFNGLDGSGNSASFAGCIEVDGNQICNAGSGLSGGIVNNIPRWNSTASISTSDVTDVPGSVVGIFRSNPISSYGGVNISLDLGSPGGLEACIGDSQNGDGNYFCLDDGYGAMRFNADGAINFNTIDVSGSMNASNVSMGGGNIEVIDANANFYFNNTGGATGTSVLFDVNGSSGTVNEVLTSNITHHPQWSPLFNACSAHAGQASCIATGGAPGYCTTVVGVSGGCTCTAC